MKRISVVFALGVICVAGWIYGRDVSAESQLAPISPHLVISQFQAGGGSANDEFIEIKNIGSSAVDLSSYVVVYRSAAGTDDGTPMASWTTSTMLQPGQFYLIAAAGGYDGTTAADKTYDANIRSMGATGGGLAIRQGSANTGAIIDSVGWGSAANIFVEGSVAAAPGNNNSGARKDSGCQDTDNNANDFQTLTPSAPRSAASPRATCSGGGSDLFAAINANPTTVSPGATTLITVTVVPATTPPSTGISVVGNFSNIGGSAAQTFFDDGSNGDVTPSDNVYSYLASIPAGASGGTKNVIATASDAQARTVNLGLSITVNAPLPNEDPLILGNPSRATADVANENNYLMQKPQYSLSYNRLKATPNWVAWRLDSSWIGTAPRQDDYRPDPSLPSGWYQVVSDDYSNSGFTRGHMVPSGDRTRSIPDNSATFLMTNFVPQTAENNTGPWEEFESYCRTLASQGNELYIFTGPHGSVGSIAQGRITVPQYTWKVVLILPDGEDDLRRINKGTRAFGIIVPNSLPLNINAPWRDFRVTVDQVEYLTGFDFFSALSPVAQLLIESRRDRL